MINRNYRSAKAKVLPGVVGLRAAMTAAVLFLAATPAAAQKVASKVSKGYGIPTIDLAAETHRQVTVDREAGQYLGHPTTVLLEDNKTIVRSFEAGL